MNRTLLLIICDFLLLNLLALTRWDKVEDAPSQHAPIPKVDANVAAPQNQDLVEAMKVALQDERNTREQLQHRLQSSESDARGREQLLAHIQAQNIELESRFTQSRQAAEELSRRYATASREASQSQARVTQLQQSMSTLEQQRAQIIQQTAELTKQVKSVETEKDLVREQMERQLQQALALKEAEIERQKQAATALAQARDAALEKAVALATAVKVAETERNLLQDNVKDLKGEVAIERQENNKLQSQNEKLAGGVDQLATKSGELARQIRDNTPINMNVLFNDFLSNRVDLSVAALAAGLFGPSVKSKDTKTILVRDGARIAAILHVSETPFALMIPANGMSVVSSRIAASSGEITRGAVQFSDADPRVVLVPMSATQAETAHVKIYAIARDPFKFTSAILISRGGKYYGEVEFKLDPRAPDYVKMKNHLVDRIFGEFSPSAGDLVLSKTGEFLGIMVNSDYCAVMKRLETLPGYTFGDEITASSMRPKLEDLRARVDRLPFALR
jgi:hypothetical protein